MACKKEIADRASTKVDKAVKEEPLENQLNENRTKVKL